MESFGLDIYIRIINFYYNPESFTFSLNKFSSYKRGMLLCSPLPEDLHFKKVLNCRGIRTLYLQYCANINALIW